MNKKNLIGIGIGILIITIALLGMDSIHEFSGERLLKIFKSPVTGILVLITGILLMVLSSSKAVEHSAILASALGISPLMIGLVLVSLGTDLPEIVNSIVSSGLGHADIDIGDSMGSVLTQLTLIFGLLPFLGRSFRVKRKEIIVMGGCLILAIMLVISIVEKGYVSRTNALFLIGSWPIYMLITKTIVGRDGLNHVGSIKAFKRNIYHFSIAGLGFVGVAVGSYAVVRSVIMLSEAIKVPEYFISFFLVGIGTSLPELVVDVTALRKKQYEIAIGDIIGSCIIDASFSIGIGLSLFPQAVSGELARPTILYILFASLAVISILVARERVDKKAGIIFIALYLFSYIFLINKLIH
ncbi:MAG: sodium:calcium antiporter [Actinobacteria bacterium]|nr:sodium:calcium antiporter [Actinomycetota bacterium]